jgi:hypothetical protein
LARISGCPATLSSTSCERPSSTAREKPNSYFRIHKSGRKGILEDNKRNILSNLLNLHFGPSTFLAHKLRMLIYFSTRSAFHKNIFTG